LEIQLKDMTRRRHQPVDTFEEWLGKQKVKSSARKLGKKILPDSYEEWVKKKVEVLVSKEKKLRSSNNK
jgi:hypothetical protein